MSSSKDTLYFRKLHPSAILPTRGTPASAGLDLCIVIDLVIEPGQRALAPTGLAVDIPDGFYGRVAPRSGLANRMGLDVLAGVIDSDYRGEIGCLLFNTTAESIFLQRETKICQLIVESIITPHAAWSTELTATGRGAGGFGSTG